MADEPRNKIVECPGYVWFGEEWSAKDISDRLASLFRPGADYWLGYRPDRPLFEYWDPADAAQQVSLWPKGRVFGPEVELSWERRGAGYALWLLAESQRPQSETHKLQPIAGPWTATEHPFAPIFLWGSYNPDEERWIEVKIPDGQYYPATRPDENEADTEKLFARLQAVYYRGKNGAVQFTRLKGVK